MYVGNIAVEGDGLAYTEILVLRALILSPIIYVIFGANLMLNYNEMPRNSRLIFASAVGLCFNVLRIVASLIILLVELPVYLLRVILGAILTPIALLLTAGHVYALPCAAIHSLLQGSGSAVLRTVTVSDRRHIVRNCVTMNAGWLGPVTCFCTKDAVDASYLATTLILRQRGGGGPEAVWIRGKKVYVAMWPAISISALLKTHNQVSWKLMDPTTFQWRHIVVTFKDSLEDMVPSKAQCGIVKHSSLPMWTSNTITQNSLTQTADSRSDVQLTIKQQNLSGSVSSTESKTASKIQAVKILNDTMFNMYCGRWAHKKSIEHLGTMDRMEDLEELYNSPLGWNKYHKMRAAGNKIQVSRLDRRALVHIIAFASSMIFYVQFRDAKEPGWLGASVDLYALTFANYAFITLYAAEILTGAVNDIVEAKSVRYGVICTRAIDRGFVRGFYVPGGHWLSYENGSKDLPWYPVTKTQINVTCNSVIQCSSGSNVKVAGYV